MNIQSGSEFVDRSMEEIVQALERIGAIGAEMIQRHNARPEELVEEFKGMIDALHFATQEAERIMHLTGAERERVLHEILQRYMNRGGRMPNTRRPPQQFRRGFTPNQPFTRPTEDPYNHT